MIEVVPIPLFSDNYAFALLLGEQCAIVDPGDFEEIEKFLQREAFSLTAMLLTHHHHDHMGGVAKLKKAWPNASVYDNLNPIRTLWGFPLETLLTPGHMADAVCFYLSMQKVLFTGDTLFAGGCGRCFSGDFDAFASSLHTLSHLPKEVRCYGGHEYLASNCTFLKAQGEDTSFYTERLHTLAYPSLGITIQEEYTYNPFLRLAYHHKLEDFTSLRKAKDRF